MASVTYGAIGQSLDLQYFDFQARNGTELDSGKGAYTIDPYTHTHHVELVLRETLHAGRIEHVPHRPVAQSVGKRTRALLEEPYLPEGEFIFRGIFRGGKMGLD